MTTKKHVISYLENGLRLDGRKKDEYRDVEVTYGISKSAEGSAQVKIGDTVVLAGVKMGIEKPYPDTPEDGGIMVNVELLPLSNPAFEGGPPSADSIELARVVDRGIRESHALDTKKLCITKAEKVWFVAVDIIPINDAGNLFDAASLAAIAALKDAKFPVYDGETLNYKEHTEENVPLTKEPVEITVFKIGDHFIVDPTLEEQAVYDARLTVASTAEGKVVALQKGGEEPLSTEEIGQMVEIALKNAVELRKKL